MSKVLITDYVHPHLIHGLGELGYDVSYDKNISLASTKDIISNYEGIIINSKTIMNREMIDLATKLRFIGRLGSGLEIVDLAYAKEKNVHVFNSPEGNRNAVAEHALGMLLALANNIIPGNQGVKSFNYSREPNRGFELEGKTIGIIGFGNTGSSFAKLLTGFKVKILAYDKYLSGFADSNKQVKEASLKKLLRKSDIISLHVPLTEFTHNMVNDKFLSKMKENSILINTSRGKVVDIKALNKALKSGKLNGACLDVLPNEKFSTLNEAEIKSYKRLFKHSRVIITPHVAGWTNESLFKIADVLLTKISGI
jgi:D-3-phosphoglycerate dehydrogenase